MPSSTLTSHDISILSKIKDSEGSASTPLLIDDSLPKDPHITDASLYLSITQLERSIISSIQAIEFQIAGLKTPVPSSPPPLTQYLSRITSLSTLIEQYPIYASARNNRAQALRRVYGDGVLLSSGIVKTGKKHEAPLAISPTREELREASTTILTDLSIAISLLTPPTPYAPISPTAARTLSQAYTQRGAIYLFTSKHLSSYVSSESGDVRSGLLGGGDRRENNWSKEDFEENASRDFMMGGRYGNDVAKALAVASNPTAKLCGAIVQEAMRKEFGLGDQPRS